MQPTAHPRPPRTRHVSCTNPMPCAGWCVVCGWQRAAPFDPCFSCALRRTHVMSDFFPHACTRTHLHTRTSHRAHTRILDAAVRATRWEGDERSDTCISHLQVQVKDTCTAHTHERHNSRLTAHSFGARRPTSGAHCSRRVFFAPHAVNLHLCGTHTHAPPPHRVQRTCQVVTACSCASTSA